MKNIAIIPIRSGSKGIKDKNIKLLNGVPLVAYTIKSALDSKVFDTVMVSTDSEEYAEIARQYGAEVPFLRSPANSGDTAPTWDVVREVLGMYEERGLCFDSLALLQATSPMRSGEDIVNAYRIMEEKRCNGVVSVCELGVPMYICNTLPEDRSLVGFLDDSTYRPRQSSSVYYKLNGAIYLWMTEAFRKERTIYEASCYAYVMDKIHSTDIDDMDDFLVCESLIKNIPEYQHLFD